MKQLKTYIIHVSDDYTREEHMRTQVAGTNLDFSFVMKGDIKDLNEEVMQTYFGPNDMNQGNLSCCYKHFLACERIIAQDEPYALILEDDMIFYKNFNRVMSKVEAEIARDNLSNFMISLEDSNLKYVKGSIRAKNKYIYPSDRGRLAGAYMMDKQAATHFIEYIYENKCDQAIDWFHNVCIRQGLFDVYWVHPPVAIQGSLTGEFRSLVRDNKFGLGRRVAYRLTKAYKKLLYRMR